ncbi:hypothetical protein [Paenibacillus elgii]|uniref:Uncharacterized protein n=1 Tax=Paenibacillus elgii TaxID=189691 RepID=A0A161UQR7_9BACL|nr:hypothetical protein [Paenibacillus elgii]KZE79971.1 hypothetical protein AV654_13260 [Paenibacillus elgii]NEN81844.1 hypothetical protein [Paenibacillus elgii]
MKIGKLLLSAGLLASLIAPLSAHNAQAAPQESITTPQSQALKASVHREYVTLSVSGNNGERSYKIYNGSVSVEDGSEYIDVTSNRKSGYTLVKAVKKGKALIRDTDNNVIYEFEILK